MESHPLDPEYVTKRLLEPPFVTVDGVCNLRDLGSYPTKYAGTVTKPRFMFRSAEISAISEEGMAQLKDLGITKVYDLRSDEEIRKYRTPRPAIEGVEVLHVPVFKNEDYSPEMMAKRFELYASGKTEAFMELYSQILDNGEYAFGTILSHVRDRPNEGFLIHCTAGKDRTGVIAALLLKLAGVNDDLIAEDYALTRVGREPAREVVMSRLAKIPFFAEDKDKALNMLSSRTETMIAFLQLVQEKYGGVEAYFMRYIKLSDDDIKVIRQNMLVPQTDGRSRL